jgi:hypothetical protein
VISFGGEYTREEWMRGLGLALRPTKWMLALRLLGLTLALAAFGLAGYALLTGEFDPWRSGRHIITGALLGYWAVAPFVRIRMVADRQWKRADGKLSLAGTIDNEGIKSNASPQPDRWDSFLRMIRRQDMVVLIGSDGLATVLPQRFFDERGWRDLQALAQYKVVEPK